MSGVWLRALYSSISSAYGRITREPGLDVTLYLTYNHYPP